MRVVNASLLRPVPSRKSDREGGRGSNPHFLGAASPLHPEISCLLSGSLPLLLTSLCPRVVSYTVSPSLRLFKKTRKKKNPVCCVCCPWSLKKWTGMRVLSFSPCRITLLSSVSWLDCQSSALLFLLFSSFPLTSARASLPLLKKREINHSLIILSANWLLLTPAPPSVIPFNSLTKQAKAAPARCAETVNL